MGVDTEEARFDEDMLIGEDENEEENAQANQYLLFNLGEEVYGIATATVTEIVETQGITHVPDLPPYVKGVINLRGRVIPLVDLRLRFNMEEREYDDRTCFIVVNVVETSVGFIVDTVADVHSIAETDVEPPPRFRSAGGADRYISGLGKVEDKVTILIDAAKILKEEELDEITTSAQEA